MSVQLSRITIPGFSDAAARALSNADLFGVAFPATLNAGNTIDSNVISVGDANSFMAWFGFTGAGGTMTVGFVHVHPATLADIHFTQIAAGIAPAPDVLVNFGAASGVGASDSFIAIKLRVTAVAAALTFQNVALVGSRR